MAGSPTLAGLFAQRSVVGVAEFAVANSAQITLSTFALGSCIGVIAYDPVAKAGGLLHFMLPDSTLSPDKAVAQPAMFADTGIPALFNALTGIRAQRPRMRTFVAGGACVLSGPDNFKIGERNAVAVRRLLSVYGCRSIGEDVGGTVNRTLHLNVGTGVLSAKLPDRSYEVAMGA